MLLYLLIIQLMVYNRTITRFAADDKPFISEWDGIYDWLQTTAEHDVVWSMWAGDHGELLFLCTHLNREWQFYTKSHELIGAFFVYPPDWGQGPPLLRDKRGLRCLVAGQLYPSFGFSSADCRCFQVSNPCRTIRSTLSMHHTALTDRDF